MRVILASGSPRRAKILSECGIKYEIKTSNAVEVSYEDNPARTVIENALAKGEAVRRTLSDEERAETAVVSADTIVWFNGKIYGKPRDLEEAKVFLRTLSGQTHYVYTGVAMNGEASVQTSSVTFNSLSDEVIDEYVARMNPLDRAGAYDIDTNGELLVNNYRGSYENIMGLPVEPLKAWGLTNGLIDEDTEKSNKERKSQGIAPVGFFDSGLGGLCILNAFKKICPNESTVYLADSANCPYGSRSAEDVLSLSRRNVRILREAYGCKMIVVACNTATAAAIDVLRKENPEYPFIGIEPAIKPAAIESKSGIVGVLATNGTFNGRLYRETKEKFAKTTNVIATIADEFVDFVENYDFSAIIAEKCNFSESEEAERIVRPKIEPLLNAGCDKIVLGCTHFPHLSEVIKKVAGNRADVIDPSQAVARHTQEILKKMGILCSFPNPDHIFFTTKENLTKKNKKN